MKIFHGISWNFMEFHEKFHGKFHKNFHGKFHGISLNS
jgi:hypothetical protein